MPAALDASLRKLARRRGCSRSELIRAALEALARGGEGSVTKLATDLVGSVTGPRDLSTNRKHMTGYGR
jgi:hypothetical protein